MQKSLLIHNCAKADTSSKTISKYTFNEERSLNGEQHGDISADQTSLHGEEMSLLECTLFWGASPHVQGPHVEVITVIHLCQAVGGHTSRFVLISGSLQLQRAHPHAATEPPHR